MSKKFEQFGETVKAIRVNRNMTQLEVAKKIGVHSQFVSNAERSKCNLPKPNMKKFVKTLSLSTSERELVLLSLIKDAMATAREEWAPVLGIK